MVNSSNIQSFRDFWPRYLTAHSSRASQAFHIGGVVLSIVMAAAMLACGMVFFLVLAVVPAQVGAAIGHKLSPRHDRTPEEHPDWAVRADLKMFGLFVTGRLDAELARVAALPASTH